MRLERSFSREIANVALSLVPSFPAAEFRSYLLRMPPANARRLLPLLITTQGRAFHPAALF
jgi:hypothetical protein